MGKLLAANVRLLVRDRQGLFWALAFPLIFTVVFSLFDMDRAGADLAVTGNGPVADTLRQGLASIERFNVSEVRDADAARRAVADDEVDLALLVTGAEGSPTATVTAVVQAGDTTRNQLILPAVHQIVGGMNLRLAGVADPPVKLATVGVSARDVDYYDWAVPGFVAMGIMSFAIIGVAASNTQYRRQQIFKRILATPLRPGRFLAAQIVARLGLTAVQVGIILAVGMALGARVYGNLGLVVLVAVFGNLVFLNIGFAVAARTQTIESASGLGNAIAIPMMFLSGVFFPVTTMPEALQSVVRWLPLSPLTEALRAIALEAKSLADIGPQLGLIAAWVVVSFALAAATFRFGATSA